jgi:hypothetical protein
MGGASAHLANKRFMIIFYSIRYAGYIRIDICHDKMPWAQRPGNALRLKITQGNLSKPGFLFPGKEGEFRQGGVYSTYSTRWRKEPDAARGQKDGF